MGQAFDRDGNVLGEAEGDTKRDVFEALDRQFKDAAEIRIKERLQDAQAAITQMRGMIADARSDFRRQAEPLALTDADRAGLEDFAAAVGEVSADVALDGYRRWLADHRKA